MKDTIIQIAVAERGIFGLSQSGVVYFNTGDGSEWSKYIESPSLPAQPVVVDKVAQSIEMSRMLDE